ncbi:MAG: flavodoxin family protein [Planctomycetes bacterium]|nr:flavodoxin family protein [Planctomycetota bacterium]
MRTLLINGSPHHDGQTMRLASEVLAALPGSKKCIHLYDRPVAACTDCGACRHSPLCPIPDPMPEYRELLEQADIILLASPLHFVSLSAPMIAFLSRLQPYWRALTRGAPLLAEKKRAGGLAVSGGARYARMFEPARAVTAAVFNSLGIPFSGMATADKTDTLAVGDNNEALAQARLLGDTLVKTVT